MGTDNECMQYGETRIYMFNITKQRHMDQQSLIYKKEAMKFEDIQGRNEEKPHDHVPSDSNSEDEQWFLGFNEKGGDLFLLCQ